MTPHNTLAFNVGAGFFLEGVGRGWGKGRKVSKKGQISRTCALAKVDRHRLPKESKDRTLLLK